MTITIIGVLGTITLVILKWYGTAKTGETSLWQPMLVPILALLVLVMAGLVTKKERRK